jgi:hypothetical protein
MVPGESLYDLLSVVVYVLDRAVQEMIDLPLEPMQLNVKRVGTWIHDVMDLQEDVVGAFPAVVPLDPERRIEVDAPIERLSRCLVDAHRLERNGQVAEAIAAYQRFFLEEISLEYRSIAADEIERLAAKPDDDDAPDLRPSDTALAHVAALSTSDLEAIDQALLAATTNRFRKVAFVVGTVIRQLAEQLPPIPDVFYAQRVIRLVKLGQLEAEGDLQRMRYGEVRLVAKVSGVALHAQSEGSDQ